jgi:hypothetical protein
MAYPGTIDSYTPVQGTSLLASVDHAGQHNQAGSAVVSLENKLGIGSGSAAANQILVGSGAGTTAWGTTWNNGALGSPTITGGTINSAVLGTPTIQGLADNTTGNVSTTAHGLAPKLPGGTTTYFRGDGSYGTPPTSSFLVKVGSITKDLSTTGTVAYTGVGFTPRSIEFSWISAGKANGMGYTDGTTQASNFNAMASGYVSGDSDAANAIYISDASGVNNKGSVSSLDADGFHIVWTKAGSPTGVITILYHILG